MELKQAKLTKKNKYQGRQKWKYDKEAEEEDMLTLWMRKKSRKRRKNKD